MAALNKVMLIGNVGGDPDVRYTSNNTQVANLSIATSDGPANENGQKETQWHKVVAFGKLAGIVQSYVRKGLSVYVEGRIVYRKYVTSSNETKYFTEIIAHNIQILTRKNDSSYSPQNNRNANSQQEQYANKPPVSEPKNTQAYNDVSSQPQSFDVSSAPEVTDDDMPF